MKCVVPLDFNALNLTAISTEKGLFTLKTGKSASARYKMQQNLEPILRLNNLQLQRQNSCRLLRFLRVVVKIIVFKMH
jgi:hypothetical protein